ncbi:hypothetical protein Ddye_020343 [Dipteronia dyeriana]|uniref:Reverse transcriptase n=1 Tax=Dipteronia dyeriana TaxID=168575 RepID=A0AAD9U002_9ROSI|nr:hypothetical protein Ddye_020343 [Dipteronia dyeriana]
MKRGNASKGKMKELADKVGKIGIKRTLSQKKSIEVFKGEIDLARQMTATNHPTEHVEGANQLTKMPRMVFKLFIVIYVSKDILVAPTPAMVGEGAQEFLGLTDYVPIPSVNVSPDSSKSDSRTKKSHPYQYIHRKGHEKVDKSVSEVNHYQSKNASAQVGEVSFSFMLAMAWNIRGSGRVEKRKSVENLVNKHRPTILLIQESQLSCFNSKVVDDTILFLKPKLEYLCKARRVLRCFELAVRLRINFDKSCVVRVGKNRNRGDLWATTFECKKAVLPVTYLELPLGANSRLKIFWNPLVNRIEKRLALWKIKFLNKWGRLVLIKSILSSIPSYFLSIFKVPIRVANSYEKLQRSFFGGYGIEKRKFTPFIGLLYATNKNLGISNGSAFVKALASLFEENSITNRIINEGLMVVIGNGSMADF